MNTDTGSGHRGRRARSPLSAIGALTVSAYPELYSCYVGIGQVANMAEGEPASYQWTLDRPGSAGTGGQSKPS